MESEAPGGETRENEPVAEQPPAEPPAEASAARPSAGAPARPSAGAAARPSAGAAPRQSTPAGQPSESPAESSHPEEKRPSAATPAGGATPNQSTSFSAPAPAPGSGEERKSELTPAKSDMERKASLRKSVASTKSIDSKTKSISGHKAGSGEDKSTADTRTSKDIIGTQESKRSMMSLGPRGSKDASKDIFTRRKSSRSIGKAVGSIISFRRGSIAEYFDRQKTAKFMNTYKLESEKPFNVDKVEKILKEVLIEALDNLTYDADKVPKQAKWASSMIRAKVKEQEYDRYKLICNVTIGEKRSQDMFATYRFLWDADRDKHASYIHENMYLYAIAVCFGIYYE